MEGPLEPQGEMGPARGPPKGLFCSHTSLRTEKGAHCRRVKQAQCGKLACDPSGHGEESNRPNCPKVVSSAESAKGHLGLRCGSSEKVSCTGASPVRTGANLFRTSARDFFCTSAPEAQTTFDTLPSPLWGSLGDLTPLRARRGRKNWRSNLETVHILAILRGLLGFQP